jgi:putative hydrolase of the HAD superfamily
MKHVPPGVRAVFFDAVGTLIQPEPSAADAYAAVGRRHGSRLPADVIRGRFVAAFEAEERLDAGRGHRTDEERERQRWLAVVAAVLDDVRDSRRCFDELYEHFAGPQAWRCEAGAGAVLAALRAEGYAVGVASNFDRRLRAVVAGLPELAPLEHLAISSEVGWKKPAPQFFAALAAMTGLSPGEVLLVGDDPENDFHGARRAGLSSLMLGPRADGDLTPGIASLAEMLGP